MDLVCTTNHVRVLRPALRLRIRHIMADDLQRMYGNAGDRDPERHVLHLRI